MLCEWLCLAVNKSIHPSIHASIVRSTVSCAAQAFFGDLLSQVNFIPDRRKLLRQRAGLKDDDKHKASVMSMIDSEFHGMCV